MNYMKKVFINFLMLFMVCFLTLPSLASAETNNLLEPKLTEEEVFKLLSENNNDLRPATNNEFDQIVEKSLEKLNENPNETVDIYEVLEELNLSDIEVKLQGNDNLPLVTPFGFGVGSVGLSNYSRNKTNFVAQPHVKNLIPFTTLDQIAGFIKGFSNVPGTNANVLQFNSYFSELKVGYGTKTIGVAKTVPHYNDDAEITIDAIVYDEGGTTKVYYRAISHPDGSYSNY